MPCDSGPRALDPGDLCGLQTLYEVALEDCEGYTAKPQHFCMTSACSYLLVLSREHGNVIRGQSLYSTFPYSLLSSGKS